MKNPARNVTPLTLERSGFLPPKSDTRRLEIVFQMFAKQFLNRELFFLTKNAVGRQFFCLRRSFPTILWRSVKFARE